MTFYRRRDHEVEARRFDGSPSNGHDIVTWIADHGRASYYTRATPAAAVIVIDQAELPAVDRTPVHAGDYIVRRAIEDGPDQFFRWEAPLFEMLYEPVEVEVE